jgi:phosphatidylserine/phosphatidylglycerophosphate/cardiolipin synthase-like enzyme
VDGLRFFTLTDGGQQAEAIADEVVGYVDGARRTLDLALYDLRLPGAIGDRVADAVRAAAARDVKVRIVFNRHDEGHERPRFPPPPRTKPHVLETLGVPVRGIPGEPDLMHHKYVVRDGEAVWTGSMNWTVDSWTRQENIVLIAESPELAASYSQDFEDLWEGGEVRGSGAFDAPWVDLGGGRLRPWFSPGRGEELSQAIATALGRARTRIRIASPVLTAGAILGTLAEIGSESKVDVRGVCDWTQTRHVFDQWEQNPRSR